MFNQTTTTNAAGGRGAEPQAKLGAAAAPQAPAPPDPELQERPRRRRFSAQHKLEVLRKADACKPGELGALLRREGIYSSNLSNWRRQREEGALGALERKRGRTLSANIA
jgi:transposase